MRVLVGLGRPLRKVEAGSNSRSVILSRFKSFVAPGRLGIDLFLSLMSPTFLLSSQLQDRLCELICRRDLVRYSLLSAGATSNLPVSSALPSVFVRWLACYRFLRLTRKVCRYRTIYRCNISSRIQRFRRWVRLVRRYLLTAWTG